MSAFPDLPCCLFRVTIGEILKVIEISSKDTNCYSAYSHIGLVSHHQNWGIGWGG